MGCAAATVANVAKLQLNAIRVACSNCRASSKATKPTLAEELPLCNTHTHSLHASHTYHTPRLHVLFVVARCYLHLWQKTKKNEKSEAKINKNFRTLFCVLHFAVVFALLLLLLLCALFHSFWAQKLFGGTVSITVRYAWLANPNTWHITWL